MKKNLLLLFACLFGALGGVKADVSLPDGWTEVTSTETLSSGANSNVYVLVDAGASTYFVTRGTNLADRPKYVSLSNPFATPGAVWTLESRGTNKYAMQNVSSHYYLNSSANGYDDFMDASWTNSGTFDFAYSDAKWDITNSSVVIAQWSPGQYMGPWDGGSSVTKEQNVACNKDNNNAPGFKIYSISRSDYAKKYLQQTPNLAAPVDVTFLIVNPNIYQAYNNNQMPDGWEPYDLNSDVRTTDGANTNTKLKIWKSSSGKGDYFQTIAGIPSGLYRLTAAVRDKNNTGNFKAYVYESSTRNRSESSAAPKDLTDRETGYLAINSGTANIGVHTTSAVGGSTLEADNFRMEVDPYIRTMATPLPDGGAMTAGLWYSFSVDATGYYNLSGTTELNNIIYVTGSTKPLSEKGNTNFDANTLLTAGETYYMLSSKDKTFVYEPSKINAVAEAYPGNGALEANTWYVYSIPMTGDYYFSTTDGVVYTTDGNQSVFIPGTAATSKVSLTKGDNLYVKSSTAQTVKVEGKFYLSTTVNGVTKWLNKDNDNITYVNDTGLEFIVTKDENDYYYFQYGDGYVADAGYNWITKISSDANKQWLLEEVDGKYLVKLKVDPKCRLVVINTETDLVELSRNDERTDYVWSFVTPDGYASYKALDDVNAKIEAVGTLTYADPDKKPSVYNATSASDAASHVVSQTSALRAYFESNALAEGVGATNYTSSIDDAICPSNPSSSGSGDFVVITGTGWTIDRVRANTGEAWTDSEGTAHQPYYDSNGTMYNAYTGITTASMSQTVSGLPAGKYLLTVTARSSGTLEAFYISGNGVQQTITSSNNIFGNGWDDTSVEFTVGAAGTAEIMLYGRKASDSSTGRWFSADNFRLVRLGDLDGVTISETAATAPEASSEYKNVTLTRTLSSSYWNTFSVPFDMEIPDGWTVKEFSSAEGNVINFTAATSFVAGKPYLVMPTSTVENPTFEGVKVQSTEGSTEGEGSYKFAAQIYSKSLPTDGTVAYLDTEGNIKKLTSGGIKGLRAYFIIPDGVANARVVFIDDATGINQLQENGGQTENNDIFDLNGRRVKNMKKGNIYVVGGKKIMF